jgi:hypothetical protein
MIGCVLAALLMFPIFKGLTHYANPAIATAQAEHPIVLTADPAECSFQFDPVGGARFTSSCDVVKTALASSRAPYSNKGAPPGTLASVRIGGTTLEAFDGSTLSDEEFERRHAAFKQQVSSALSSSGYPSSAVAEQMNYPMMFLLLFVLALLGVMTYGPIAAWLVELFPARIRYTSMSLPYHLGNGWFGGFLPSIAFAMIAYTGDIYSGLWYPVVVCVMTAIVGTFFLRETRGVEAT